MSAENIRRLFRFIDWVMNLPKDLEDAFSEEAQEYEKEKHMPYVSTFERVETRRGFYKGIEAMLDLRFGEQGLQLMPEIRVMSAISTCSNPFFDASKTAASPDERRLWTK